MIGQHIVLLPEVDSTNNYAAKCLAEGKLTSGTVILAEHQTAGRGQRGNSWQSGSGQFAASAYLDLNFLPIEQWIYLNMLVALSVKNALATLLQEEVLIKWPNDVLWREKKIAGILIEGQIASARQGVIIGLGVNLKHDALLPHAIGASLVKEIERLTFLETWIHSFNALFPRLRAGNFQEIRRQYLTGLWRLGEEQLVATNHYGELYGKIVGVNTSGDLEFQTQTELFTFGIKEIQFTY